MYVDTNKTPLLSCHYGIFMMSERLNIRFCLLISLSFFNLHNFKLIFY